MTLMSSNTDRGRGSLLSGVGAPVGCAVGADVGASDGRNVMPGGKGVGAAVGIFVGASVGVNVWSSTCQSVEKRPHQESLSCGCWPNRVLGIRIKSGSRNID